MLSSDDLRRPDQEGLYGYTGHSGKSLFKVYYLLEPKNAKSDSNTEQGLGQIAPDHDGIWIA